MSQVNTGHPETRVTPTVGLSPVVSKKSLSPLFAITQRANHLRPDDFTLTASHNTVKTIQMAPAPNVSTEDAHLASNTETRVVIVSRDSDESRRNLSHSKGPTFRNHQIFYSPPIQSVSPNYSENINITVKEFHDRGNVKLPISDKNTVKEFSHHGVEAAPNPELALAGEELAEQQHSGQLSGRDSNAVSKQPDQVTSEPGMEDYRAEDAEDDGAEDAEDDGAQDAEDDGAQDAESTSVQSEEPEDSEPKEDGVELIRRDKKRTKSAMAIFIKNHAWMQEVEHVRLSEETEHDLLNVSEASQGTERKDGESVSTTWKTTRTSSDSTTKQSDTVATGSMVNVTVQPPSEVLDTKQTEQADTISAKNTDTTSAKNTDTLRKSKKTKQTKKINQTSRTLREFRVAKTGAILLTFFVICFGPYTIVHLCHLPFPVPLWAQHIAMWCVFFNSILSPLIYGFMNKDTRNKVKAMLHKCFSRSNRL